MTESKSGKQKLMSPFIDSSFASKYGILLNTLGSQIIPLGHYYKITFYATVERRYRTRRESISRRVAFLQLNSRDFAVVAGVLGDLIMYRSHDNKWIELEGRFKSYRDIVSFKGKFYVVDMSGRGHVFVIEPSLEVREILSVTQSHDTFDERAVVSGDNELLLVQRFTPGAYGRDYMHTWFRVFRLEEEGERRWVRINDLEDRVVFLGYEYDLNLCCSAKELPGMKRNCVMFIDSTEVFDRIRVFDLGTKRTHKASECRGCIGVFGENIESPVFCGIVALPNRTSSMYDSFSEFE